MAAPPQTAPCRVLVVEDSPEMAALVVDLLRRDGFEAVSAATARAAHERFAEGGIDIMLIDIGLPDISGEQLFADVQQKVPGFPCAFLTAQNALDKVVDLMRAGALDYLQKPIKHDHFQVRMRALRERVSMAHELGALRDLLETNDRTPTPFVVGHDRSMLALLRRVALAARTEAPVLISGESGTGKELVARAVHKLSRRASGPFVAVNTSAIPIALWESQFFGHIKGAFTDAKSDSPGLIASAEKGTLFLDEVGEIPLLAQAKLLRFIQERQYRPVGSTRETAADVRLVAATHRDLKALVTRGEFREDLYYRLDVVPIAVPPLRERRGDIPALAQHFLSRYAREFGVAVEGFTPSALARLTQFEWPGNVRQLENLVQQMVAVATTPLVRASDVPLPSPDFVRTNEDGADARPAAEDGGFESLANARRAALRSFEHGYLTRILATTEGNITKAAKLCRVPRKTLWRLLKANGIVAVREGVASKPGRPRTRRKPT